MDHRDLDFKTLDTGHRIMDIGDGSKKKWIWIKIQSGFGF